MTAEAAAALLGTSPATLSLWQERFGYPVPVRCEDGRCLYQDDAMFALRDALSRELSITSAIAKARRRVLSTTSCGLVVKPPRKPGMAR